MLQSYAFNREIKIEVLRCSKIALRGFASKGMCCNETFASLNRNIGWSSEEGKVLLWDDNDRSDKIITPYVCQQRIGLLLSKASTTTGNKRIISLAYRVIIKSRLKIQSAHYFLSEKFWRLKRIPRASPWLN